MTVSYTVDRVTGEESVRIAECPSFYDAVKAANEDREARYRKKETDCCTYVYQRRVTEDESEA